MQPPRARDLIPPSHVSPSVVSADAPVSAVVARLLEDPRTYEAYVTDADGRLLGVITAQRLARYVFSHDVPHQGSAVDLLDILSVESAGHLAVRKAPCVHENDLLPHVIETMLRFDLIEIPVVDDDRFIVGSLNLLHILAAWKEGRLGS